MLFDTMLIDFILSNNILFDILIELIDFILSNNILYILYILFDILIEDTLKIKLLKFSF